MSRPYRVRPFDVGCLIVGGVRGWWGIRIEVGTEVGEVSISQRRKEEVIKMIFVLRKLQEIHRAFIL